MAPLVLVFFVMLVLDATGTLLAVGTHAGLEVSGETPRSRRTFASDALGTVLGAVLGTNTVTSYVESAAGVEQGSDGLARVPALRTPGSAPPPAHPAARAPPSWRSPPRSWARNSRSFRAFRSRAGSPVKR
jgi:hypothetical protein